MTDRAQDMRLVEALLFAAAEPLTPEDIAARLPEGADIAGVLAELEELYRNRGVNLVRVAGKWIFRTAPDLAPRLMLERTVARKLSRAAVETLAIVAYHQPVTRAEIEQIRGVALSKGTLDLLMEAGWVKPRGRRQTPGRPATWVTTEAFLVQFGLDALTDLPGVEELRAAGLLDLRPGASIGESADRGAGALGEAIEDSEAEEPLSHEEDAEEPEHSAPTDGMPRQGQG
jgi:segregation and condensation protein B